MLSTHTQELAEYDAVVNCMGLRGAVLFGDDSCYPIRGQVLRARAPWIKHHYVVDERFYVIPNNDLGALPASGDAVFGGSEACPQGISLSLTHPSALFLLDAGFMQI